MVNSSFADPGWLEYVEHKQGLEHRILKAGTEGRDSAYAEILVFVNKQRKLRTPKLMPYMPLHIQTTQTTSATKLQSQWLQLGSELAEQMKALGYGGRISMDPQVTDIRPWQWQGISVEPRYTYLLSPSETLQNLSNSKRKSLRKTEGLGYTAGLSDDLEAVHYCLKQSEVRQNFDSGLGESDLRFLASRMTKGHFRAYLVKDDGGEPVSTRVALCVPGNEAIGIVAGTDADHLKNGAAQLSIFATLHDLLEIGIKKFDFGGANIESVANSKMQWGGVLTPFYNLNSGGPRSIALQGKRWLTRRLSEVRR